VYAVWIVLSLLCIPMFLLSPKELAPTEDQGVIFGILEGPANATIDETIRYAAEVNRDFMSIPETAYTFQITFPSSGFGGAALRPWGDRERTAFQILPDIAESDSTVLIQGPTGSGKELFARAIHSLSGRMGAFVPVNVAGLDDTDEAFGLLLTVQHKLSKWPFTQAYENRQMVSYLLEGVIINAVNFPSIPKETMAKLRLHLDLAEQMGSMVGQMVRQPCDINITYSGYVTEFDTRVLTHAALKGLLSCFTDRPVNFVNAPYLAKAKGIKVQETIQLQAVEYTNLIRIDLPGIKDDLNEIWGTVFAKKYPRIVRIGKIFLDAVPQGPMILVQNVDRPGVIGNIGMTLAKHGINIARFQLGRAKEQAICTVNLDTPASEDIMHEIRALPHVLSVRYIKFGG
jgi:hypothetical protein